MRKIDLLSLESFLKFKDSIFIDLDFMPTSMWGYYILQ